MIIPDYPVTIPCPQRLASQRTCCFRHYLLRSCCYLHQWPNDGPDFVGRTSLVIDIYGMSSENSSSTLLKMSFEKGSDGQAHYQRLASKFQTSREILRALCIDDWQSEPITNIKTLQRWKVFKRNIQWYMNWRNIPNIFTAGEWIADVMNHTAEKSLQWRPPLEVLTGQTVDISILLCFLFWDVVYVTRYDDTQYKARSEATSLLKSEDASSDSPTTLDMPLPSRY
jgi:hypothetical protein